MSDRAGFRERLEDARRVHVDARVFARHLLGAEPQVVLTRQLLAGIRQDTVRAQTSAVTLYQLLVEPYRRGADDRGAAAGKYLSAFPNLEVVPVDGSVARQAAQVRARLGTDTATCLQIATAVGNGADVFLTEGSSLRRIAGATVVRLEDYA